MLGTLIAVMILSLNRDGSVSLTEGSYGGGELPEGVSIVSGNPLPADAEYCTHTNGKVILRSESERSAIDAQKAAEKVAELDAAASDRASAAVQSAQAAATIATLIKLFPALSGREAEIAGIFADEYEQAAKSGKE